MLTNQDTLSKATKELMLKEPFYGLFLITMNKVWLDGIDTAGVSKHGINMQLAINPMFWEGLSPEFKVGILKHELLHIAFQHLTMREAYSNHKIFNIAADLEINQYIDRNYLPGGNYPSKEDYEKEFEIFVEAIKEKLEAGELTPTEARNQLLKIPGRALFLEDYAELNLQPKMGTDYYYKKIMETMDQNGNSSCPGINDLLGPQREGDGAWGHPTWDEFENLSSAEKKLVQKQVDYQLKSVGEQVTKSRGIVPGELKGYIDSIDQKDPPKFDWRGYLRQFAGGSIKTYTKKTRRKPSKRFKGSPGLRVKQRKHILVAIDTSGSVSDDELVEFFHEIHHMHKTGADVTVIQCDTAISNIAKYKKPEDGKIKVHGRGGTSFQPVVDYFNEHSREYSCLIYCTDGEAPPPDPLAKGRMLWVLSERSHRNDRLPGPQIKLN